MIRVLIVDDEPLARERLQMMLDKQHDINIVGECSDGASAVKAIREDAPDLVFLDIQMPELDGFGVLEALDPEVIPTIIFVTAFDQFAIRAFEVHALDYLLKPFDRDRFLKTLQRARSHIDTKRTGGLSENIIKLLDSKGSESKYLDRIAIKSAGRIQFVKISEIDWIEAAGNYVKLHVGSDSYLHRETMSGMEEKIDPESFLRIHRSTIVNIDRIKEMQPFFNGEYVVILEDETRLTLSRRNRTKLQERLNQYL